MRRLVVIGGGEHARVVAEAARTDGRYELVGFVDPEPCEATVARLALPRLGGDEALDRGLVAVLGIGSVGPEGRRKEAVARLAGRVAGWGAVIHSAAWVSPTAHIGEGTVVMALV